MDRGRGFGNEFPELQIWRFSRESVYQKVNGTLLNVEGDDVYEYTVDPPLAFQPGDVLGLFQPDLDESVLQLEYNRNGGSVYYTQYLFESGYSSNMLFNISGEHVSSRIGVPLVSASIGKIHYIDLNNSCTACIPADLMHTIFLLYNACSNAMAVSPFYIQIITCENLQIC